MVESLGTASPVAHAVQRVSTELISLLDALAASAPSSRHEIAEVVAAVEGAGRLMDAARIAAVAPLTRDTLAAERLGYASATAAVGALARVTERTARDRLRLAEGTRAEVSVSGASLPPRHEHVAAALMAGQLGLEAAALVTRELDSLAPRVTVPARAAAEAYMVALASGLDPTGQREVAPVSVDYLAHEIRQIGAAVDPDGALPREERAVRGRSIRVGAQDDDGLVPFSGRLLPEVGSLFLRVMEAWRRSPRFVHEAERAGGGGGADAEVDAEVGADDSRTPEQRRHDAFAEVLMAATAAEGAPQLNGRAVTVLVTVSADELRQRDGRGSDPIGIMSGSQFPVSRSQVQRFIDAAGYREVTLTAEGAVVGISSPERCFTAGQSMAIAARDGERCFAPGCTSPHTALQVHHVHPWSEGGPTITSNGILLCYWHHQRVDDGPWQYRMVAGLPEVRGPGIPEWHRRRASLARAA